MNVEAYETRPRPVEALQYLGPTVPGHDVAAVVSFSGYPPRSLEINDNDPEAGLVLLVLQSGSGPMRVWPGDWVVKDNTGAGRLPAASFEADYRPRTEEP